MSVISAQVARHFSITGPVEESIDKAITTRPSSSANFYVDSEDKTRNEGSGNFLINKGQSLFNGFFNRIAVAEVGLDWGLPNVSAWWGNNQLVITNNVSGRDIAAFIPDGFYTAFQALDAIAIALNDAANIAGDPIRFTAVFNGLDVSLNSNAIAYSILWDSATDASYELARQLFTTAQLGAGVSGVKRVMASPRILGTTYIDIVSPQLTYNQSLKDSTTDNFRFDVLYRWYFAEDNVPLPREKLPVVYAASALPAPNNAPAVTILTESLVPVLEGYIPFVKRRAIPYPKQIRWDEKQPIGQVAFQCYDDRGRLIDTNKFPLFQGEGGANFQFQLQLLLSEN